MKLQLEKYNDNCSALLCYVMLPRYAMQDTGIKLYKT